MIHRKCGLTGLLAFAVAGTDRDKATAIRRIQKILAIDYTPAAITQRLREAAKFRRKSRASSRSLQANFRKFTDSKQRADEHRRKSKSSVRRLCRAAQRLFESN